MLMGDVGKEEENVIICGKFSKLIEDITFLKSAHHGSKHSNSEEILSLAKPAIIAISCGENNIYGHPHKEALERMVKYSDIVYITKNSGMIWFQEKSGEIYIKSYLKK